MEDINKTNAEMECSVSEPAPKTSPPEESTPTKDVLKVTQPQCSPDYDLLDEAEMEVNSGQSEEASNDANAAGASPAQKSEASAKRKLSGEPTDSSAKIQKLDHVEPDSTQTLDDEVSEIIGASKRFDTLDDPVPSVSRVRTPARSSPRRLAKRSNSADLDKLKTPKTPKSRPASADITKSRKTPRKVQLDKLKPDPIAEEDVASTSKSRPSVEFVAEIEPPKVTEINTENSDLNDSQDFQLVLSPSPVEDVDEEKTEEKPKEPNYSSDPVVVKDRKEILDPGKIHETRSEGYTFSDQNSNLSQPLPKDFKEKATDQESTDSIGSLILESPDHIPTVASKLISKLSNGDSSTPTESSAQGKHGLPENSDSTPDMIKLNGSKSKRKNESFKNSNSTTPSTISPLQNGHSLPASTPQIPVFDIHVSHNEDCEFLSLYVVRIDNDLSMDMYKEYQRVSKRFTMDGYQADVSATNSTSSVTSGAMISLPNRASFSSTISSLSTLSSRTSDGNFLVPQAPRKSVTNPSTTVKGYDALLKKLQEIFSHVRDTSDEANRSISDDKVSVGIQTALSSDSTLSNGNASPEEVGKCDKATPKSSLKKSRVRGRRHIATKTKRALLPTQLEEPEFMHGMNSPEMVPSNGENGKDSSMKSPKEEKPLSTLVATPKSVSKLKQKRRPTSPRPVTPVEKVVVKPEYPGFAPDTVVLAKWVDKRYYSGKVQEITEPNKYLIKFDDGQSKILLDDFIIFGDMKTLPLQGQSVYAMVDEEQNYEPGLVLGVEENDSGTVTYKCTTDGDTLVMVTASELYLTEDQARSLKESVARSHSPSTPSTPRNRRHNRELDLDNIIQGPRSARNRDKGVSSAKKRVASPKSPKASTSGVKSQAKSTPVSRKRLASESSEISESSNSAPPVRLEEVAGVEPEVQRTPRKIDGVKAGPGFIKGAAKQNIGKKNSKLTKFENDEDTISQLGPIPAGDNKMFAGLHFLLTCTDTPRRTREKSQSHYSSEEDGETAGASASAEDVVFCARPFHKERLKEQLEAGGGVVYSHFDDVPKNKYSVCKLISPRPCLTAKYIQCLAADIRAVTHGWVIESCIKNQLVDVEAYLLPAGWSLQKQQHIDWAPSSGKRNTSFFKDKLIVLCSDNDSTFLKFWDRVCTLAGANTRVVNEDDLNMAGALALVTEWDCPHEVQNKANQDNIPLVSTHWVIQCLVEAKVLDPNGHANFSFAFTEQE
ncbi:TP53-binding protein 1-like [Ostrinia furnacalis]|uniref:TP53-binding protein 1-like n=1 Tax=Ostrinia furnacalis TaxID=93504 RepID=UPI00103F735E|nr:TP53-binding protein 1-like [Ostrinia furnacalis]